MDAQKILMQEATTQEEIEKNDAQYQASKKRLVQYINRLQSTIVSPPATPVAARRLSHSSTGQSSPQ